MDLRLILIVLLILILVGALPTWNFHSLGWYPSAGTVLLIILVVLLLRS